MPKQSYEEVVAWMFSQLPMYQRQGPVAFKKNLDNIHHLCKALGHPQRKWPSIHVAGTNGKGTTTHMIAAALQANGLRVGVYTSPHYMDFRERIKVNGALIPEEAVVSFIGQHKAMLDEIKPSFFEMTVAMAFDFFAQSAVDIAVIEVGLGGRLDSTNVIAPLLSVITNISYDHMAMLGNTLPLIAAEKAGIIKPSIPVIIGERQPEVEAVFTSRASLLGCAISFASDRVDLRTRADGGFDVVIDDTTYLKGVRPDIGGPFLHRNFKTALAAIHDVHQQLSLDKRSIKKGLSQVAASTYYIGRWQILQQRPQVIADSAHNEAGLAIAMSAVEQLRYGRLHCVLGFADDKDVVAALRHFPQEAAYYWAKADIPRGLPATTLTHIGEESQRYGSSYTSVREAYDAALLAAGEDDLIYVGGSIFVVAEIL